MIYSWPALSCPKFYGSNPSNTFHYFCFVALFYHSNSATNIKINSENTCSFITQAKSLKLLINYFLYQF